MKASVWAEGVKFVVDFDYSPEDRETGWGDDVEVNSAAPIGDDEAMFNEESKDVFRLLSKDAQKSVASAALEYARTYKEEI